MLAFLLASIIIELTPGPNMTWLAVLGATRGRFPAFAAVAGIAVGLALAGLVAGLGLTVLFDTFPNMLTALRYAGTLYLLYLGYVAWVDAGTPPEVQDRKTSSYFMQGIVSNALNPKAYLFYAAILPQFLTVANERNEIALLTAVYVMVATSIHFLIALASGSLANWLAHAPHANMLRRALALAIAAAAIWFFISTGRMT